MAAEDIYLFKLINDGDCCFLSSRKYCEATSSIAFKILGDGLLLIQAKYNYAH